MQKQGCSGKETPTQAQAALFGAILHFYPSEVRIHPSYTATTLPSARVSSFVEETVITCTFASMDLPVCSAATVPCVLLGHYVCREIVAHGIFKNVGLGSWLGQLRELVLQAQDLIFVF